MISSQNKMFVLMNRHGTFVSVVFITFVTSCVGLLEEKSQIAHSMSFTWASYIANSMYYGM